jgi:hypothetical protein
MRLEAEPSAVCTESEKNGCNMDTEWKIIERQKSIFPFDLQISSSLGRSRKRLQAGIP